MLLFLECSVLFAKRAVFEGELWLRESLGEELKIRHVSRNGSSVSCSGGSEGCDEHAADYLVYA